MTKRWTMLALGMLGAFSLACSGEVTVNDEPLGAPDEEAEEEAPAEEEEEEEAPASDELGRKDVVQALKGLKAKVGDLDGSCKAVGDPKLPVAKWINSNRKQADTTEIGCEGTRCKVKMMGPSDAEWMLEVSFDLNDGQIDVDSFECRAAG